MPPIITLLLGRAPTVSSSSLIPMKWPGDDKKEEYLLHLDHILGNMEEQIADMVDEHIERMVNDKSLSNGDYASW